ncbi:type I glutamate--ammonia ligase, partial [bacterium]|nr:type I glutamate--ammonia ligase [bacterium]MBU3955537.1 type I glutamate--ammonia ligase [bacterium]
MKNKKTAEDVLKIVKEKNVRFIKIWFVDVLGAIKSFSITANELPRAFKDGMGFDGSSIEGFARIYESDLIAKPDPASFEILPWRPKENAVARMFCDLYTPDDKPYEGDTRYVLQKNLKAMAEAGYDMFNVGPELEYFYFKNDKSPETIDKGGYFDYLPLDTAHDLRRETIMALEDMGVIVEYSHHEVAPSQHEIDLRYAPALEMADNVITYKVAVKSVAWANGVYASFMPKPIFGENGSGMHVHQSLFLKGKNIFFDPNDEFFLSSDAKYYIAGIMKHAREICLVTNQWTNSYKRLVPGFEAPVYIVWGRRNRSALVRVPMYKPGQENATRIEIRFPDPACNPYLAFSVMLAAGLDGIKNKMEMPDPVEIDVFHLTDAERKKMGIKCLTGSLIE